MSSHFQNHGGIHRYLGDVSGAVDCSNNPYDLRPAAQAIVQAALKMRTAMPKNQPFVILMDELHHVSSHVQLKQLVTAGLLQSGEIPRFNFELPHNSWSKKNTNKKIIEIRPSLLYRPYDYDDNGRSTLSSFIAHNNSTTATVSKHDLYGYLYKNNIPTMFCGAPHIFVSQNNVRLDFNDPALREVAKFVLRKNNLDGVVIDCSTPDQIKACMTIRNHYMAFKTIEENRKKPTNFIIQEAGMSHVFGSLANDCDYVDSLAAVYKKLGIAVLPVLITTPSLGDSFDLNDVPPAACETLKQSIVVNNLAEDAFQMTADKDFSNRQIAEERKIIQRINRESGGEVPLLETYTNKAQYVQIANLESSRISAKCVARGPANHLNPVSA